MSVNSQQYKELGALKALQFDLFTPYESVFRYGVFTRKGGVSLPPFDSLNTVFATNDVREHVAMNQQRVREALGFPDAPLVVPSFAHGNKVATIRDKGAVTSSFYTLPGTDAVITKERGVILFLSTADCSPVLFYEKQFGVIGLAHAGWRGVVANVVGETIKAILDFVPTTPESILVAVGPTIGPCCYRMMNPEQAELPGWEKYLGECGEGLTAVDLGSALEDQLVGAGVPKENIFNSRLCTACHQDQFFSHWAEKPRTGRFPTAMVKL
jgi:purine-nucleoside/S-methyl-5'-thioadenosine phosphorylase / adenosine deaminase